MNIALKEANETEYWLDLLKDATYLSTAGYMPLSDKIKSSSNFSSASLKPLSSIPESVD